MIQQTPQADVFKRQLRESLQRETLDTRAIKIARHANVYNSGDQDEMVYFIESGQIKLLMLSSEGRECLLAIHSARVGSGTSIQAGERSGRLSWNAAITASTPVAAIEAAFNMQVNNPDGREPSEVVAECLAEQGAVDADYTAERFDEDLESASDSGFEDSAFDVGDPDVQDCLEKGGFHITVSE